MRSGLPGGMAPQPARGAHAAGGWVDARGKSPIKPLATARCRFVVPDVQNFHGPAIKRYNGRPQVQECETRKNLA